MSKILDSADSKKSSWYGAKLGLKTGTFSAPCQLSLRASECRNLGGTLDADEQGPIDGRLRQSQ